MKDKRNLSLVMDFYELTMSQCYFNDNKDKFKELRVVVGLKIAGKNIDDLI